MGSSEFLFDDYIPAFRSQSYFYCICQLIYPFFHQVTSFDIEFYFFCHNKLVLDFNFWDYLQFTIKELQGYHFCS